MSGNQQIKCNVQSCRFNDKVNYCTLADIEVGSSTFDAQHKNDTECTSFEVEY